MALNETKKEIMRTESNSIKAAYVTYSTDKSALSNNATILNYNYK